MKRQNKVKFYHDRKARSLPSLRNGEKMLFKHNPKSHWVPATVVKEIIPKRSYQVKTPEGVTYQRNREHILLPSSPISSLGSTSQTKMSKPAPDINERPKRETRPPLRFADYADW